MDNPSRQQILELIDEDVEDTFSDEELLHYVLDKKVSRNLSKEKASLGERAADCLAQFAGSWTFVTSFTICLIGWIIINICLLADAFDPYPFILLNLVLSCIAAIQAPLIMMSQNRQEEKDRERSKKDYMVNLKSELELRILHEKLDHLIMHQQQQLLQIQKIQIDMMNDILQQVDRNSGHRTL